MADTKERKRGSLGAVVGGCALVLMLGALVLGYVAYEAFELFKLRAKAAEAQWQLAGLRQGVSRRALEEELDPSTGTLRLRGLPPSLPRTPATPRATRQPWPASADPLWTELGIDTSQGSYFAYEIVSDPAAGTVVLRAVGDLDGDGVLSERSTRGVLDPETGEISWDTLVMANELE